MPIVVFVRRRRNQATRRLTPQIDRPVGAHIYKKKRASLPLRATKQRTRARGFVQQAIGFALIYRVLLANMQLPPGVLFTPSLWPLISSCRVMLW